MSSLTHKADALSDYDRRELDCWIATNIEWHSVQHDPTGVMPGSDVRLADLAFKAFKHQHPRWKPSRTSGPFLVCHYSFSPSVALNIMRDTEYIEGWSFAMDHGKWRGTNDGLQTPLCNSFALCVMLALKKEYNFQNRKKAIA